MNRLLLIALTFAVAVLVAGLQPASATILTFGGSFGESGSYVEKTMPGAYGDNVNSVGDTMYAYEQGNGFTPNVGVGYSGSARDVEYYREDVSGWWGGNGIARWRDGLAGLFDAGTSYSFVLTPNAGYGVKVNSFKLAHYPSASGGDADWTVLGGASTLVLGTVTVNTSDGITVNTGMTGFYFGEVTLKIDNVSVGAWNFALDDLNFDQQMIPEPSMLVLLSTGLVGLICYAWRKRK